MKQKSIVVGSRRKIRIRKKTILDLTDDVERLVYVD